MIAAPSRVTFLVPAVVCLAVAIAMAVQVARPLSEPHTWTPLADAPDLDQVRREVEVWLDGRPLHEALESGALTRADSDSPPTPGDFRVRVNRGAEIGRVQLLLLAVTATAGLTLLLVALAIPGRRGHRPAEIGDPETAP